MAQPRKKHSNGFEPGQLLPSAAAAARARRRRRRHVILTTPVFLALLMLSVLLATHQHQQQQPSLTSPILSVPTTSEPGGGGDPSDPASSPAPHISPVPPPSMRPNVRVNVREWARLVSDDIRLVSNRTSCVARIGQFYERQGEFSQLDPVKIRENILAQINALLSQHKAAVNGIVQEAERAAQQHQFIKDLRVSYTDVHRTRNELEPMPTVTSSNQDPLNDYTTNQYGGLAGGGTSGDRPSFTSISGGTPVPGPAEWQTPIKSIVMQMNRNFGDIPVNISMSAVHLPLPIYPGLPEIMNGIAWTERLDAVFRRNLVQFMHVHHQYYGDTLGFLRTFPAHKWRIPRNEPDLFDARTRPWYIAGAATPKDVVILVDTSGSMTGLRREIARGVVFEILDTLTINDNFAVMRFSETVTPVGLPACNLRKPKLVPQLEELCGSGIGLAGGGGGHSPARTLADHLQTMGPGGGHPAGVQQQQPPLAHALPLSPEHRRELAIECANWRRQWDARTNYLRDQNHADHDQTMHDTAGDQQQKQQQNDSLRYLDDDAYRQSITNVSLDIRDAFLLPATSRNIRYLKSNFSMPTAGIANFTRALMAGFELLQSYNRTNDLGSQCNQAIMLITDGALHSHRDVFNRYNYPGAPIRVFTYMIGREVGDIRPTKEMACRNRGYYTHVINLGEVREQVQKYLPVMARPLVLAKTHPLTWTNAYGDETYQVHTDWVLEVKRRERARIMLNEERERLGEANSSDVINLETTGLQEYDEIPQVDEMLRNRIICEDARDDPEAMDASLADEIDPLGYSDLACHWTARRADLLMSVVKPVFDQRNTSIFFERYLSKNIWQEKETLLRNAQLLGVAAVDLRIDDIVRAAPTHLLGPNGYSILLGQNGFVMHHPDFRALLEDPFDKQSKILKPYFSAVDLTHIEQVYHKNESEPLARRREDDKLIKLREAAVKRATGVETMYVKRTIDCRKRPHIRLQTFYYGPVKDTPYSFMLALPASYGLNRIEAKLELEKGSYQYTKPGEFDLWTVHPEYRYCELGSAHGHLQQLHLNDSLKTLIRLLNMTSEGEHYELDYDDLSAISGSSDPQTVGQGAAGRQAANKGRNQPATRPLSTMSTSGMGANGNQVPKFTCDKELFPSLLFDIKATYDSFVSHGPEGGGGQPMRGRADEEDGHCTQTPEEMRTKLAQIYGLELSFVATRSGLTRARVFDDSKRIKKLVSLFIARHDRAVDEPWYSRTVDWNLRFADDATIITVSYNAYIRLIAKLRQRITQRHPAINDTRANCDPSLVDDDTEEETAAAAAGGDSLGGPADQVPPGGGPDSTPASGQPDEPTPVGAPSASDTVAQPAVGSEPMQNDDPQVRAGSSPAPPLAADQTATTPLEGASLDEQLTQASQKINYAEYTSFDFLDLLANSSVHVVATQTIVANRAKKQSRVPVGVTGHLYDYAIFARKFLNSTSLDIRTYPVTGGSESLDSGGPGGQGNQIKVDICPGGECPTRCGIRNDTIDCLLVDNNGFIVVAEELPHIGRSLIDYDENLMAALVERRVYHKIQLTDYQAICARNDQMTSDQQRVAAAAASGAMGSVPGGNITAMLLATASASSSSSLASFPSSPVSLISAKLDLARSVVANLAGALVWTASTLYSAFLLRSAVDVEPEDLFGRESLIGRLHQWQRSALMAADAQSAIANQSLLASLPNKTYLRPCETTITLYETRPYDTNKLHSDAPEYYETKCGCSGWFVYDAVPKTNLLMLIVNTTSACRRCEPPTTATSPAASGSSGVLPLAGLVPLGDSGGTQTAASPTVGVRAVPAGATSGTDPASKSASSSLSPEEQVCHMLERDQVLYVQKPSSCLTQHPDETQIHICGGAHKLAGGPGALGLLMAVIAAATILIKCRDTNTL